MNKKSNYQKPTVVEVQVRNQHLLDGTGGHGGGPTVSREQRSDWSDD